MIPADLHEHNILQLLSPIRDLLQDPAVSEVMINGPREVYLERSGRLELTERSFEEEDLSAAVVAIAQFVGIDVGAERPILEGRLPDGSRVEAVLPPAAPDGPMLAIRRFATVSLTAEALVASGFLGPSVLALLTDAVRGKQNVLVSGGTGSGKTTLLNVLGSLIEPGERVVAIEDARELQLQTDHVVQLEARPGDARGRGRVTIRDLFRASLRLRPDRIVVGELRGGEALEFIQAMTSGHGGGLSTIHASHPRDALARLETLCLMSDLDLPLAAIRQQVASAVDLVVQTCRTPSGRCITELARVHRDGDGYRLEDVMPRVPLSPMNGQATQRPGRTAPEEPHHARS